MKNIAIIPARGGSKRLPNKNILPFDGIPLLAHSILYAQANYPIIDEVYVSTDSPAIKKIALEYGAQVIDRPAALSGDFEPTISALKQVVLSLDFEVDSILVLQVTNPLRPANLLKAAFEIYLQHNLDSLFTVTRDFKKLGKITENRFLPLNYEIGQRSQDLEPLFFENGLLYISKSTLVLKDVLLSENAYPYEINHPFAKIDIDTQEDLDYATWILNHYKANEK
ncbi:MAG: cytidylyltransferase domain-containing protein [Flavobacterium psychrophilum]|jgi:CMP-N-acetylneuraminic acid synthetase